MNEKLTFVKLPCVGSEGIGDEREFIAMLDELNTVWLDLRIGVMASVKAVW